MKMKTTLVFVLVALCFAFFVALSDARIPKAIKQHHRPYPESNSPESEEINPNKATPLNVHIIAHTHDDVGWLKTVDEYFVGANQSIQDAGVQYILDTVITALQEDHHRKFIYVEIAFFKRWWNEQDDGMKAVVRNLVAEGRLEFINGGWCMNDEAGTHYNAIIDQMTQGHLFLQQEFGIQPTIGWHIDPFGHANTQASLFAQMGFNAFFFGRIDYQDHDIRNKSQRLEFVWRGSNSLGADTQIFTHILYTDYCYPPGFGFEWGSDPVQDDPRLFDINIKQRAEDLINEALHRSVSFRTNNVLIPFGCDFQFENAHINFKNMDKLIAYINSHPEYNINISYSTPSRYLKAVYDAGLTWEVNNYDFFPYADGDASYWTGYFTSRSALKAYIRSRNALLQAGEKLYVTAGVTVKKVDPLSAIDTLSQAHSVAQHHDAIAGTSKQHVAYDYAKRLSIGSDLVQILMGEVIGNFISNTSPTAPSFTFCPYLNVSLCPILDTIVANQPIAAVLYNSLGWQRTHFVRIPVSTPKVQVVDNKGNVIPSQIYPNADVSNHYNLVFQVTIPPLGFTTAIIQVSQTNTATPAKVQKLQPEDTVLENSALRLTYTGSNGKLASILNKVTGQSFLAQQDFIWYNSSAGNDPKQQAGGAYIMRPNASKPFDVNKTPSISLVQGNLVSEVTQIWTPWASAVTRLYGSSSFVEFEATLGPIDISDGLGKELVSRYTTNLKTGSTFYTDSEGMEMQYRKTNWRPTWNYTVVEPVAANYYPMNAAAFIQDPTQNIQLSFITDRSHACGGLADGQIEHLLQRRLLYDDSRGVGEPLNETQPIRTFQLVSVGTISDGAKTFRPMAVKHYEQPIIMFSSFKGNAQSWISTYKTSFTALNNPLPDNVHFLTLKPLDNGQTIIRLHHIYAAGEDPVLSKPVTLDLATLFVSYSVNNIVETTLTANQPLSAVNRYNWKTSSSGKPEYSFTPLRGSVITLRPMEIRTFLVNLKPKSN